MRRYTMVFELKGPVHVGNGQILGKRDYFRQRDGNIAILDGPAFVAGMDDGQLSGYCKFLESQDSRTGLQDLLDKDRSLASLATRSTAYSIDTKLARRHNGKSYQYLDVHACIKDVYGKPYVPGSSIKGVLRGALLTSAVLKDPQRYAPILDRVDWRSLSRGKRGAIDEFMHITRELENRVFRKGAGGATNDLMRFVSVSDSEPLDPSCLVFAKKYDKFSREDDGSHKRDMGRMTDRSGNELDIYRECIAPGTTINANLDIDERVDELLGFQLDAKGLERVFRDVEAWYEECFLSHFDIPAEEDDAGSGKSRDDGRCQHVAEAGPLAGQRCRNHAIDGTGYCRIHQDDAKAANAARGGDAPCVCYLGGGVGFDEKTVAAALLKDDPERVAKMSRVLYAQFPTRVDESVFGGLPERVHHAGFMSKHMSARYKRGRLSRGKDDHRHWQDATLGVSPHTLKMGIIGTNQYQMGLCGLRLEERA